jgi:hypothetical protein
MHLQPTLGETMSDALQDLLRLRLRPAVRDYVIRVPLEWHVRMHTAHPVVKREVQKHIGHQRTDHAPYAKGNFQFERVIAGWREQSVLDLRRK